MFKVWCRFTHIWINSCLRSFWDLQCSISDMTIKSTNYKRGSMSYIRISGQKYQNILYRIYFTTLFRYFVYDSMKLILLSYGYCCTGERCGPWAACHTYIIHKSRINLSTLLYQFFTLFTIYHMKFCLIL